MSEPLPMRSFRDVLAHRLIAQALITPRVEAAAHMLATQDQIYAAGVTALQLRSPDPATTPSTPSVVEQIRAGTVVRAWTQRGTVHLVAAQDVQWLARLCSPRVEAAAAKRRPGLGLDETMYDRAHAAFRERLADGPIARPEAYALFASAGVSPEGGRGQHLLRSFGGQGDVVQGPRRGNDDTFGLTRDLPVAQRELDGDDALAELAARYLASHGPATAQDLSWWSGLTVRDVKRGVKLAGERVIPAEVPDRPDGFLAAPGVESIAPEQLDAALAVVLDLPAFDEYLIGYTDRAGFLPPELVPVVGPTKNGMCRPFRVRGGIIEAAAS